MSGGSTILVSNNMTPSPPNPTPANLFPGSSSSSLAVHSNPNNRITEEGEVNEHDHNSSFQNSYPAGAKRTSKDILADARKNIKQQRK
jgi:hypothetical protein